MADVKAVVVGDGAVGKTCLLISFTSKCFPPDYVPTIFDNYAAHVMVDNRPTSLALWDTAGQEEYDRLRRMSYPNTDVFLLAFSIASPTSLSNILERWYTELKHDKSVDLDATPIVLVGTKADLRDDEGTKAALARHGRAPCTRAEGEAMKESIGACAYVECSAKTDMAGVRDVFDVAVRAGLKHVHGGDAGQRGRGCGGDACVIC